MERNPLVTDEHLRVAIEALAQIASGKAGGTPEVRVAAASTLLGNAWVYGPEVLDPVLTEDEPAEDAS